MNKIIICILIIVINYFDFIKCLKEDQSYWFKLGEQDLEAALNKEIINGVAKNVILFIGDGMGLTTTTTARIYNRKENGYLSFEKFTNIATLKTYSANKLVSDSCSAATALFCGVKANQKTSGVDATVQLNDCTASLNKNSQLDSIIKWGQNVGKLTGFVTTTRVTHATPSALYAHTPNRHWECEDKIPLESRADCKDIARQLIEDEPGKNINVIMGGGRQCLQSNVTGTEADPIDTWSCYSKDGRDLIKDWIKDKRSRKVTYSHVTNNEELQNSDIKNDYVLGIFANGHLKMDYERDRGPKGMPSLTNMTEKAIEILSKNSKSGFLLVVEGGLIDFGHHRGHARKALDETISLSDAVEIALELTESRDTLIIVTSDHSHSLVFSGYASRNQSVLDVAQNSKMDNVPYTSLLYGTGGPNNYRYGVVDNQVVRHDPSSEDTNFYNYSQQAAVLTDEVTHSGTDVLVYAKGPMAHLFNSVHEQTYVAYVISYAAKIGPYQYRTNSVNNISSSIFLILFLINLLILII